MEVTDNIDNSSSDVSMNGYNFNEFTHNGRPYYPKSIGDYDINLTNTTIAAGGFGTATNYTLSYEYITTLAATFLTNTPGLKASHKIEFKFTGNFQAGSTYLVTADTMIDISNTSEIKDGYDIDSNNHFIFTVPAEPEPEP